MSIRLEQIGDMWVIARGYWFWKLFWCEENKGWVSKDHIWFERCKLSKERAEKTFSYLQLDY